MNPAAPVIKFKLLMLSVSYRNRPRLIHTFFQLNKAGMAKQYLDDAHVRLALQEMGREVPQGVLVTGLLKPAAAQAERQAA